jgi:hypothetical protein
MMPVKITVEIRCFSFPKKCCLLSRGGKRQMKSNGNTARIKRSMLITNCFLIAVVYTGEWLGSRWCMGATNNHRHTSEARCRLPESAEVVQMGSLMKQTWIPVDYIRWQQCVFQPHFNFIRTWTLKCLISVRKLHTLPFRKVLWI